MSLCRLMLCHWKNIIFPLPFPPTSNIIDFSCSRWLSMIHYNNINNDVRISSNDVHYIMCYSGAQYRLSSKTFILIFNLNLLLLWLHILKHLISTYFIIPRYLIKLSNVKHCRTVRCYDLQVEALVVKQLPVMTYIIHVDLIPAIAYVVCTRLYWKVIYTTWPHYTLNNEP